MGNVASSFGYDNPTKMNKGEAQFYIAYLFACYENGKIFFLR